MKFTWMLLGRIICFIQRKHFGHHTGLEVRNKTFKKAYSLYRCDRRLRYIEVASELV